MAATLISFHDIPKFGFAHHLFTEESRQIQTSLEHSFVLVYVKSGHLTAQIYDKTVQAPAGSVLILFRHVPFHLFSEEGMPQDYCSIQVYTDYSFALMEDNDDFPKDFSGLALPIVTPPCSETDLIKKDMYTIVSNLAVSRTTYDACSAMTVCGILSRLDSIYRQKLYLGKSASTYWEYKIKSYLADHMAEQISLEDLSAVMNKTPNYLNSVFSKATGISIHRYVNREKMLLTATLMEIHGLSFREACENVGISDLSHGYRLFKQHMGVTPAKYMEAERQFHLR